MTVPSVDNPLQPHEKAALVDPLKECDDVGMAFYETVKQFVDFCLSVTSIMFSNVFYFLIL